MKYDIIELAALWNSKDITNPLLESFIAWEQWADRTGKLKDNKEYRVPPIPGWSEEQNEFRRSLCHVHNLINGKYAEIIFRKHCIQAQSWKVVDEDGFGIFDTDRDTKYRNTPDFSHNGATIEFKNLKLTPEEIIEDLNKVKYNPYVGKYLTKHTTKYRNADVIINWDRWNNKVYMFYKVVGSWVCKEVKNISYFDLIQMRNDYDEHIARKYTEEEILKLYNIWSAKLNKENDYESN